MTKHHWHEHWTVLQTQCTSWSTEYNNIISRNPINTGVRRRQLQPTRCVKIEINEPALASNRGRHTRAVLTAHFVVESRQRLVANDRGIASKFTNDAKSPTTKLKRKECVHFASVFGDFTVHGGVAIKGESADFIVHSTN